MYYQNYEDYMRSVLGYPALDSQNTYESFNYMEMPYETSQIYANPVRYSDDIMELYPDIYKIVNPMVCKICEANTKPITRELIDQMTEEIYLNLESQPELNTVINVRVNTPNNEEKINISQNTNNLTKTKTDTAKVENRENLEEREDRQRRPNNTLRDLIRILILNRLLGGFFPGRPPRPRPPRPPMRPPYSRDDRYYEPYLRF